MILSIKKQCQQLYPGYKTLVTSSKWQSNLQQYTYALQRFMSQGELSIARGRRSWKASKEEVAETFAIPGRRLTNIEPLLDSLGDLVHKEEFGGRTASSEVTLRFRLHPLEEAWLKQLDNSQETVKRNGLDVPSIPAELLLREAKKEGYTDLETMQTFAMILSTGQKTSWVTLWRRLPKPGTSFPKWPPEPFHSCEALESGYRKSMLPGQGKIYST